MDEQTKDQIRDLIIKTRIDKALDIFSNWAELNGDSELKNAVFGKKSEYSAFKKEDNMGFLSSSETNMRRNRLVGQILSMVDSAEKAEPETAPVQRESHVLQQAVIGTGISTGTILFLAANPTDTAKLQLEKEFIQVLKNLEDKKIAYALKSEFAVTPSLLQTALLKHRPRIVHFSGHGDGGKGDVPSSGDTRAAGKMPPNQAGIVLQTPDGKSQLVSGAALANLFKVCLRIFKLEVVLLNACSSEEQASAIFNVGVPFVIGMNTAVKDASAIQFSAKFYEGLASEGDVEIAFELAKAGVMLENGFANDADIPVLYKKSV